MAKKERTEAELQALRDKKNGWKKSRAQQIKEIMAENEKKIGKKQIEKNRKEAKFIAWEMENEALQSMSEEEINAKRDKMHQNNIKYWTTHHSKVRERDAQILATLSEEDAIKFKKARRLTESLGKIEEFMKLPDEELDELYEQHCMIERVKEAKQRKARKKRKRQEEKEAKKQAEQQEEKVM